MSKTLSEQVAGLERHLKTLIDINANLVGENADLIAERDNLQRQVQEARDEIAELRAGRGRWPETDDSPAGEQVPRVISADQVRPEQIIAYWQEGVRPNPSGSVTHVRAVELEGEGGYRVTDAEGRFDVLGDEDDDYTIVLLEDAPEPESEPVTAETIHASEPGSTWEASHNGKIYEWGGARFHEHVGGAGLADTGVIMQAIVFDGYNLTRSTAAPRGDYSTHSSKGRPMHDATDIRAQLDRERNLIEAATEGPWKRDMYVGVMTGYAGNNHYIAEYMTTGNAEFAVHARSALPVRNAQIEAVLALHKPAPNPDAGGFMEPDSHCKECNKGQREEAVEPWPCDTVRAIEEAA